ncbi:MAG: NAD(P)H-binding protein [Anaerolineaceae bacterium]
MILVTGGTGFIGRTLIRQLVSMGKQVRTLLRPSQKTPNLPGGIPVEVAVCGLTDERSLRAAMKDVEIVFHLAGTERAGSRANLNDVDIAGTQSVVKIASEANVKRIFYLSHLGADRASAFPLLKTKAIAESFISRSSIPYTIVRSALAYGPGDQFTTSLVKLLEISPGFVLMPGNGSALLQPIWVEDLVTCLTATLVDDSTDSHLYSVGGIEYLSFHTILEEIMAVTSIRQRLIPFPPAYLRLLTVWLEQNRNFPLSAFLLDYLASDRTCPIDAAPRTFGLMPARFSHQLEYLKPRDSSDRWLGKEGINTR